MFAIPGLLALLFLVYVRPQELHPVLGRIPFLYLCLGLAALGLAIDIRLRVARPRTYASDVWGPAYFAWSLVTMLAMARWAIPEQVPSIMVALFLLLALGKGLGSFRALGVIAAGLLVISLLIVMIGVHQAYAPLECVRPRGGTEILVPEGIPCETAERCHEALGGPTYFCERVGLFGTTSIAGRIRFRGIMQDPNELALVTAMAIPLAFAFVELRRSGPRLLLAALTLGAGALCIVHTRSRSGQLALLAALGVYFLRRWRWRGAALASALAVPVLLLGGRSGSEADESTELRLGYWSAAIEMARASPVFGVGRTQFVEHQPQTAHSSVMLALAEVGLPGLFLWTATIYITLKGLLRVLTLAEARGAEARVARTWATALLASLCAFLASALFLSLSDHYVLWIYLGLAGAVVTATRHHEPAFRLDVSLRDLGVVAAIDTALVIGIHLYVRARGF